MIEKKYFAPNAITAASMFLGFVSITMSIRGDFYRATWFIILAMVCDGLDGKTARKLDAFSEFGKEFDSFSDAISFGLAPAILIYCKLYGESIVARTFIMPVSFIYAFCGVMRLVKFNIITVASSEKGDFSGMPIPNAASMVCSYILFTHAVQKTFGVNLFHNDIFMAISVMAAILMVTTIRFKTPEKTFNFIPKKLIIPIMIIMVGTFYYSLFIFTYLYVIINLIHFVSKKWHINDDNSDDQESETIDEDKYEVNERS